MIVGTWRSIFVIFHLVKHCFQRKIYPKKVPKVTFSHDISFFATSLALNIIKCLSEYAKICSTSAKSCEMRKIVPKILILKIVGQIFLSVIFYIEKYLFIFYHLA